MSRGPSIVLAEDHAVVRQGLRLLLEAEPDLRVVGEADDGLRVVELVERVRPDVVIMDLVMPGLGGLDATREVLKRAPRTRVVVLSMHADEVHVIEALRSGASGYVLKDAGGQELVTAVREAAAGRRYLSPPLSESVIEAYLRRQEHARVDPYDTLSLRERQVLHLVAEGLSARQIGERLYISPRTVEVHRGRAMAKLGLRSSAELVRYAVERGLLPPSRGTASPGPRRRSWTNR
jgi:DNA-binding NarL/FixJ family response regulator